MKKYLHTFKSGFPANKGSRASIVHRYCFVFANEIVSSISLFEILEKLFECLETRNSILETRFSILENRNSKLEPRNSILYSRKLRGSRIEFRVETVNLPLSGTVVAVPTSLRVDFDCKLPTTLNIRTRNTGGLSLESGIQGAVCCILITRKGSQLGR